MFNLVEYEKSIRDSAAKANITNEESLKRFIFNLAVLRPHFDIFPASLDFRQMGQQWNKLSSDVRNSQKNALLSAFTKVSRARSMHD